MDPGVAPTYVGDERVITRSDAEIRRRDAGIPSPAASRTCETVTATTVHRERRRRMDPGVALTYVGDERVITRSDAEIIRRDGGIHSPSASGTCETVTAPTVHPWMRRVS